MKALILEILQPAPSALTTAEEKQLLAWESEIESFIINTLQLLAKIKDYGGGRLWRARGYESFSEYLQARFGHSAAHAGRPDKAGNFVHLLEGVPLLFHFVKARYAQSRRPSPRITGFRAGRKSPTIVSQGSFRRVLLSLR